MSEELTDSDEVLFRQIHPRFLDKGEPASDRFMPQPNDNGFMSVDRESLTSAADSFALYVRSGRSSAAVFGISVGEFGAESIGCKSDPIRSADGEADNPAHALADYTTQEPKSHKNISKRLKRKAMGRGQLHPTPEEDKLT